MKLSLQFFLFLSSSTATNAFVPAMTRPHFHRWVSSPSFSSSTVERLFMIASTDEEQWASDDQSAKVGRARGSAAAVDASSSKEQVVDYDIQRRETLTGGTALFALLPLLKDSGLMDASFPAAVTTAAGSGTVADASAMLTPEVLQGDTIIRTLWLNRLAYPVLIVAMEIGLFEALNSKRNRPLSITELGERTNPPLVGQGRVLEALVGVLSSLDLLKLNNSINNDKATVEMTPAAKAVLTKDSPFFWGPQLLAADGLTASLRMAVRREHDNVPAKDYNGQQHSTSQVNGFIDSMQAHGSVTALATGEALVDILGPNSQYPANHLLDMAGGSGVFAKAIQNLCNVPHVTLADIPLVAERFQHHEKKSSIQAVSADLFDASTWPIGPKMDVHLLANVVHDWGESQTMDILRASHQALTKSDSQVRRLILVEQLLNDTKMTGPLNASLASVSMLLGDWRTGKQYSFVELKEMMTNAGFAKVELGPSCGKFHTAVIGYI